ncbi:MAG: hypothetical protein MUW56_16605 [Chryseobacterium sp.]|uniref:HD domain-containing protein n=1 Tax=Chryseobacterium sp. TaxID=1871047 RepID=UPI0025B86DA6|nr:hypothetical protein [Chryseobacterium sp.]MCJ7935193.1 hypothetical protein [Chryseobacterium sp.]
MHLKDRFEELCFPFSEDHTLVHSLWKEIETKYSQKGRYYHNLSHLEHMFRELEPAENSISDCTAVSFSVFYHDIIYNATSKSNEENSAVTAEKRLKEIGLGSAEIRLISAQILTTKSHQESENSDTNYLLDADLSILGKDFETYIDYTQKIRREYAIYPDFLYQPGRKKVLQHFLKLKSIFKTDYFKEQYEIQARENIKAEIQLL